MQAITSNNLKDGFVYFFTKDGTWTQEFKAAGLYDEASLPDALATAKKDEANQLVVGVYEIDVDTSGDEAKPAKLKERIRAFGPTVPYGYAA